ncbi:MAG: ferrous iron transporter B [Phycisphaerales bacterium]
MTNTAPATTRTRRIAVLGNPNTGKTSLFNRLTGLRHRTSNFPGTTQHATMGDIEIDGEPVTVIDLPGIYALELEQQESELCRRVLAGTLAPKGEPTEQPDALVVTVDATNLSRNLMLVGEALRRRLPTVVCVTMLDIAQRRGLKLDLSVLSERLGCTVVEVNPRKGTGIDALGRALVDPKVPNRTPPGDDNGLLEWVDATAIATTEATETVDDSNLTDRLDRAFTHPLVGLTLFAAVMTGLFWLLFRFASTPMDLIDGAFAWLAGSAEAVLPDGLIADLIANGIIAGVGATVIFVPQIALLFFVIALLEDSGYLARASFVMDRVLRPFGLRGTAFVPLLSSHACALPGIMACRAIPDRRERLAAILVAPFMTCSARLPVYALLVVVLFPGNPGAQALAFVGCYALGIVAGLLSALVARRTFLRGKGRPMALELPSYRVPSVTGALRTTAERSWIFLRKAGTVILAISIVLWWLGSYPQVQTPQEAVELRESAAVEPDTDQSEALLARADELEASHAAERSFMGRIGKSVQPVFAPLGYDWQLSIGVMASFAAREVFVSTMAVVTTGQEDAEDESVLTALVTAKRSDGSPVFDTPTAWSLLVYYVLAMQCLPTLAVTAREAGGKRWAALQLGWMMLVAYVGAAIAHAVASSLA